MITRPTGATDSRLDLIIPLDLRYVVPVQALVETRLAVRANAAYNERMEISFGPELEAKVNRIASKGGKAAHQVVQELVASYLDHDEWFRQEVETGLASLDRGKSVAHDEVRRQMDRILGS